MDQSMMTPSENVQFTKWTLGFFDIVTSWHSLQETLRGQSRFSLYRFSTSRELFLCIVWPDSKGTHSFLKADTSWTNVVSQCFFFNAVSQCFFS